MWVPRSELGLVHGSELALVRQRAAQGGGRSLAIHSNPTTMTDVQRAAEVRGRTMRWAWTEGPTKGKTHEHTFHEDGTVEWREVGGAQKPVPDGPSSTPKPAAKKERVEYGAVKVSNDVSLVSYLSDAGFTLTVALNFGDNMVVGFASSAKEWYPVRGTFEVVT